MCVASHVYAQGLRHAPRPSADVNLKEALLGSREDEPAEEDLGMRFVRMWPSVFRLSDSL